MPLKSAEEQEAIFIERCRQKRLEHARKVSLRQARDIKPEDFIHQVRDVLLEGETPAQAKERIAARVEELRAHIEDDDCPVCHINEFINLRAFVRPPGCKCWDTACKHLTQEVLTPVEPLAPGDDTALEKKLEEARLKKAKEHQDLLDRIAALEKAQRGTDKKDVEQ